MSEEDNSPAWGRLSLVGSNGGDAQDCQHDDCGGEPASPEQEKLLATMGDLIDLNKGGTVVLLTCGGPTGACAFADCGATEPSPQAEATARLAEAIQHLWLTAMMGGPGVAGSRPTAEAFLRKLPADLREAIRLEVCRG